MRFWRFCLAGFLALFGVTALVPLHASASGVIGVIAALLALAAAVLLCVDR